MGIRRLFASGQSPTGKIIGGYRQAATLKSSCIGLSGPCAENPSDRIFRDTRKGNVFPVFSPARAGHADPVFRCAKARGTVIAAGA